MSMQTDGDEHTLSERKAQLRATLSRSNGPQSDSGSARRTLIDQVNNNWQDGKTATSTSEEEFGLCDLENEDSCPSLTRRAVASRRFRKMGLAIVIFLVLAFCIYQWYLRPRMEAEWEFKEGFLANENGTYGIAKGGDFDGVRVQDLDPKLLPGGDDDPEGEKRLIFVGDIHGCFHELKKLLKKVGFDERKDLLIAVGDVITKGPDNIEVLDELIRLNASSVRGNHEDKVLAMAPYTLDSTSEASTKGTGKDAALLHQLSSRQLQYLRSMPLILRIPPLPLASTPTLKTHSPLAEEILVVHAGLVPAVPLEKQDPYFVMNMRSIQTKTHLPLAEAESTKDKSKPWRDIWGWYNDRLFQKKSLKDFRIWDSLEDDESNSWLSELGLVSTKKWPKPQVIIYGHHAKAGLQITRWSKGLDTSCVKGGKLTVLVLDARGEQKIISVDCKDNLV